MVIEDTLPDLEAARQAGCITIALAGTLTANVLREYANYVINELMALAPFFKLQSIP